MSNKINIAFKNLNPISHNIIKYGSLIATIILILSVTTYIINDNFIWTSKKELFSLYGIEVATAVFAEFIIGGLIFDYVSKKEGKK